jgi:hypothetical protein
MAEEGNENPWLDCYLDSNLNFMFLLLRLARTE